MHSSSTSLSSSLTDSGSTDDSTAVTKFPVSKSIPNIPDDSDSNINEKIVEGKLKKRNNKDICGTIIGPSDENFHPVKACEKLRKALNGLDTNDKAIIEVTVGHNNFQRQRIINTYEDLYSTTLIDDFKDELGGFFLDTVLALFVPAHVYLANLLHYSLCNHKLNRTIAVEIACTRTTTQMKAIKNAYQTAFCNTIEQDIVVKVKGMFGAMLYLLLCSPRDEQINETDMLIEKQVDLIVKDSNGIEQICHSVALFEKLFIGHSWRHIAAVMDNIDARLGGNGHFIETQIIYNRNIPSDIKNMLLTIVKISRNTQRYFAEKLHDALGRSRPDYKTIIRIIVSRSEIDLSNICYEYKKHYSNPLTFDIRKICHGEYYQLLTSLLAEDDNP
ncbi:Annexin A11 [Dirofilaria immitis]|nr:Annexin A11 [Dirofilaria immitis]